MLTQFSVPIDVALVRLVRFQRWLTIGIFKTIENKWYHDINGKFKTIDTMAIVFLKAMVAQKIPLRLRIAQLWRRRECNRVYPSGMCLAEHFLAERGGARKKIRRAGRRWKSAGRAAKRTRKSTDPKIRQKWIYCYWDICSALWCFDRKTLNPFTLKR